MYSGHLMVPVYARLAQLVEHTLCKADAVGSNPTAGSRGIYTVEVAGLPVEQLSKGSGGSTPSIPTTLLFILNVYNSVATRTSDV